MEDTKPNGGKEMLDTVDTEIKSLRSVIVDMEDDLHRLQNYARGLELMTEEGAKHGLVNEEVAAVQQIIFDVQAALDRTHEAWRNAFELSAAGK